MLTLSFGAVCISFAAVFVKMLGVGVMGPTAIGFWRTFLGAVILLAWSAARRNSLAMPAPILGWSVLAGFVFFLDLYFWHRSIIYAGAGMATILANTQVFMTALLGFLVFKEKLTLRFFVAVISAVFGVTMLIGVGSGIEFDRQYLIGIGFGLLTGAIYGIYIIIMKTVGHKDHKPDFLTLMAWISFFTAAFLAVASFFEDPAFLPPDLFSLMILIALALVAQAIGWWTISRSLPRLDASRSGLILLLQPVLAAVWGVLFFSEYLSAAQIVGAVVTLTAIYIGSVRWSV